MVKVLARLGVAFVAAGIALLLGEGLRSVTLQGRAHVSLVHQVIVAVRGQLGRLSPVQSAESVTASVGESATPFLADRREFDALVPLFRLAEAGVGNTDAYDLLSESAAINVNEGDGCTRMKSNIRKTAVQIRSSLFEVYDAPLVFFDADRPLPRPIEMFLARYGLPPVQLSANEYGERLTIPAVDASRKVFIAGDSVALGAAIDDSETIASRLQQRDATRQYVNLGVSGVGAPEIACALERAAQRYQNQIAEVIYVLCDNDYNVNEPRSDPAAVVAWLKAYAALQGGIPITIVRSPYLETLFPISTEPYVMTVQSAKKLSQLATEAGFRYVDITNLALREVRLSGSPFGVFRMFVDHVHLSRYGVEMLVETLVRPGA